MAVSRSPEPLKSIGPYELLNEVGEGSMGTVYRALHRETKEIVAVKIISESVSRNPLYVKRFEQEFRVASQLDHPNVVRMLEYSGAGPNPYLVMEFIDGESLGEMLDRVKQLPEEEAVRIIVQVAQGLQFAHDKGMIHRDVKPDNVMVSKTGEVKLADLGLAKETGTFSDLTRPGTGLGTPCFMAPEQFKNAKNASIRCDIYSLAATLYQMVTGKVPFGGLDVVETMMRKLKNDVPPPRVLAHLLSGRTNAAIWRAMDASPEKRPASCLEFVEDLLGPQARKEAAAAAMAETTIEELEEAHTPTMPLEAPPPPPPPRRPEPVVSKPAAEPQTPPAPPAAAEPRGIDWPTIVFIISVAGLLLAVTRYLHLW